MTSLPPERPMVPGTLLPLHFVPVIGRVAIEHTLMDQALIASAAHIAGMDYNTAISIFSQILAAGGHSDILRNLATTKVLDDVQAIKLHVLADQFDEFSKQRNIVVHSLPYWYGRATDEVGYFRDVVKTFPQIKTQPPYKATITSLERLIFDMNMVKILFGSMLPHFMEKEGDPPGPDASWLDAANFPWPDKFQQRAAKWNRKQSLRPSGT